MFTGGYAAELNFKYLSFLLHNYEMNTLTFKNFNLSYLIVRLVFLISNYTKYILKKV